MKPRGRPKKIRKIKNSPHTLAFSPRGRPGRPDEVSLQYEELEAIRLSDFGGLKQSLAAKEMGISRQSFGRVLKKAHQAVAEGLVRGKIIRVQGGSYELVSQGKKGERSPGEERFKGKIKEKRPA